MKTHIFRLLFILIFLLGGLSQVFATNVSVSTVDTLPLDCDGGNDPYYKYVGETWRPYQVLWGDTGFAWTIGFTSSKIEVYNPHNAININDSSFSYSSNIKPEGVAEVVAIANQKPFTINNHGSDPNVPTTRLVFQLHRKPTKTYLAGVPATYQYTDDVKWALQIKTYANKPDWTDAVSQVENRCFDLYTRWCGDGLISHNEVCDPAEPSHSKWGIGGCSTSCQPINK
jgi:hypothetical protein